MCEYVTQGENKVKWRKMMKNINEIADSVIKEILSIKDPFEGITVVFHNMKVAQWFKAYYLKNNSEVMMNVEFKTLPVFINDMVNPDRKYTIMDSSLLRNYIIKILMNPSIKTDFSSFADFPIAYIYDDTLSKVEGAHLYELSDKLASLYLQYENDGEDITGWEKELYEKVMTEAEAHGSYTTKRLFEHNGIVSPVKRTLVVNNSYLTDLFRKIIDSDSSEKITLLSIENPDTEIKPEDPSLFSAPSVLREVEGLHSKICKIVRDEKDVRFNDILVYVQNIGEYKNSIKRVFDQYDKDFPSIPYRIIGESQEKQDMADSLAILFDMANKGYFTRKDFYEFVKNSSIKYINKIDDTDINEWMDIIVKSNTYSGLDGRDDWDYLKKRVLLSSLVSDGAVTENITEIGGENYIPITSIGLDDERREKMINIIDELLSFCDMFRGKMDGALFGKAEIEKVQEIFDSIFSIKNTDGEEKNYLYREVGKEFDYILDIYDQIPANTLLYVLMSAPSRYSSNPSDMFVHGVTFLNFNSDDALSAKHVFIMGLNSKNFPRIDVKSEIDFSKNHKSSKELDENTLKNVCSASGKITFSYVNADLEKDAEQYPAELITKICAGVTEEKIPLDETRDYAELFTWKEFENKEYANNLLFGGGTASATATTKRTVPKYKRDSELKIRDFKKYIDNTIQYKLERIVGKQENKSEDYNNEFRPVTIDKLNKTILTSEIIKGGNEKNQIKETMTMKRSYPEGIIGEKYYDRYFDLAEPVIKEIENGYTVTRIDPLKMKAVDQARDEYEWTLIDDVEVFRKEENGQLYYIEPCKPLENTDNKLKHYANAYFFALMDVASRNDSNDYNVIIEKEKWKFHIDSNKAKDILNEFYLLMTDYEDLRYLDANGLTEYLDSGISRLKEFRAYVKDAKHTIAGRFDSLKLIDDDFDFGYTEKDFESEYEEFVNKTLNLLNKNNEGEQE